MKSILMELYYGKLFPYENIAPKSKEYREVRERLTALISSCKETLSKEQYEALEMICDLEVQSSSMTEEKGFITGFRLASLLMIEIFTGARD